MNKKLIIVLIIFAILIAGIADTLIFNEERNKRFNNSDKQKINSLNNFLDDFKSSLSPVNNSHNNNNNISNNSHNNNNNINNKTHENESILAIETNN